MQITRNTVDANPGPSDSFTGSVFIDTIASAAREHVATSSTRRRRR